MVLVNNHEAKIVEALVILSENKKEDGRLKQMKRNGAFSRTISPLDIVGWKY